MVEINIVSSGGNSPKGLTKWIWGGSVDSISYRNGKTTTSSFWPIGGDYEKTHPYSSTEKIFSVAQIPADIGKDFGSNISTKPHSLEMKNLEMKKEFFE